MTTKPWNIETISMADLIARIEQLFDCRDGHYGAFAHGGPPEEMLERGNIKGLRAWEATYEPLRYATLAWRAMINPKQDVAGLLRARLLGDFYSILRQFPDRDHIEDCGGILDRAKPRLYWRFHESCRIGEERNRVGRYTYQTVRTRVAIPDCDWSRVPHVAEGAIIPRID